MAKRFSEMLPGMTPSPDNRRSLSSFTAAVKSVGDPKTFNASKIYNLLKKTERNLTENKIILAYLLQNNFFISLTETASASIIYQIVEELEYTTVETGKYVFRYGDVGDKYYIIVEGRVGIEVPFTAKEDSMGATMFTEVGQMGPGDAFGELALIRN
jgi:hypothetical protein